MTPACASTVAVNSFLNNRKLTMKRVITALLAASILPGCASIFSGTTQEVSIRTTPGARYTITNSYGSQVASGTGEGSANLVRGVSYFSPHAYKLRVSKEGYQARSLDIEPGMNPWYFANLLIGGVVGMLIVDPLTGAMFKLHPSAIDIPLEPTGQIDKAQESRQPISPAAAQQVISRFDYSAGQVAKQAGCMANDNPEVIKDKDARETLIFRCANGQKLAVTCSTSAGCE